VRIAADGKPFDIDEAGESGPGEVEIIQFLRPNARRRRMVAEVGENLAKAAQGLVISAEELGTGDVAIYVRDKDGDPGSEHIGFAENGPGENSPTEVLKRMIRTYSKVKETA
jgi:hypothetical protein